MLTGYYPSGSDLIGRGHPRQNIGDRATWPQYFMQKGYYTARISKISHMNIPTHIEEGDDGVDDIPSWTERFNSQGPEWK
jgi:iduronate 2-sulfatase